MLVVFPCSPINPRKVDDHFKDEFDAAKYLEIPVGLVDHDALQRKRPQTVRWPESNDVVYRGWMLTSIEYQRFQALATSQNCVLRTKPAGYKKAHELPGWADLMQPFMAETAYGTEDDWREFDALLDDVPGPSVVLRDYTKSMKHYWDEACFIPNIGNFRAAQQVGERFRELRGDDFCGSYVLRQFENYHKLELRTWWFYGDDMLLDIHPDYSGPDAWEASGDMPPLQVPDGFEEAMKKLNLPFVTADFALRDDNVWRLVEIGDGQVSDLGKNFIEPDFLLSRLWRV